ncbi:YufK family protein [Brevibacterium sp. PAMC21349]|nr:YufK family protein [Brevibacterium sp. PAMC21349]
MIGGACSLFSVQFIFGLGSIFIATNVVALIYFVNKLSPSLNLSRLVGLVFFPIFVWTALISIVAYAGLKLYNSVIASLPI